MAVHFDRWEKDPFFSAAEEVQESADRMESTYRTWVHALKDTSHSWNLDELRRDLRAALGTAKWQLEEFERAVKASYKNPVDEAKDRHHQFILAMEEKVSVVENVLQDTSASDDKIPTQWVRLDEGEQDEFALFLAGPTVSGDRLNIKIVDDGDEQANHHGRIEKPVASSSNNKSYALGKDVKTPGHRRTASASAEIGSWDITVHEDKFKRDSSNGWADLPPRRVPSYSGFVNVAMESAPKVMLPKNGFRKLKAVECQQDDDVALLRSQELSRGVNACCEKRKSCLNTDDDCCNKHLYGWYGAVQRMLQRSQYQVQYSRPVQLTFWTALLLFFIVLFVLRAI
ncbi:Syntaxin-61 [Bienertia sinuspersici]